MRQVQAFSASDAVMEMDKVNIPVQTPGTLPTVLLLPACWRALKHLCGSFQCEINLNTHVRWLQILQKHISTLWPAPSPEVWRTNAFLEGFQVSFWSQLWSQWPQKYKPEACILTQVDKWIHISLAGLSTVFLYNSTLHNLFHFSCFSPKHQKTVFLLNAQRDQSRASMEPLLTGRRQISLTARMRPSQTRFLSWDPLNGFYSACFYEHAAMWRWVVHPECYLNGAQWLIAYIVYAVYWKLCSFSGGWGAEKTRTEGNVLLKPVVTHWLNCISLIAIAPGAKAACTCFIKLNHTLMKIPGRSCKSRGISGSWDAGQIPVKVTPFYFPTVSLPFQWIQSIVSVPSRSAAFLRSAAIPTASCMVLWDIILT